MSWSETFRTALEAIGHRRMRSVLTVLGILIGIAAVMLTVGLGQGAQSKVAKQIDALGTNLLVVSPGSTTSTTGVRSGRGSATTLTTTDADTLANPVVAPDISGVAPTSTATDSLVNGSTNWSTSVVGTTPSWLSVRARTMSEGRFISSSDVNAASPVMVLGSTTAEELFGERDPVGQTVTVDGQTFSIIGELATAGSSGTTDEDDQAIVPMTTFAQRLSTSTDIQSVSDIYLEAKSSSDLSAAYQEATAALLTSHDVTTATEDFTVSSQASLVATATSTTHTLTVLLGGIAAISLLVGGIGVMNIMLVSVTERIREIGLRKALGATPRTILKQFLTEASVLGLAGGIVGISLGAVGALVLPHFLNQPVDISAEAAGFALVVSVLIGVAAGVYPASRAAKLAPIDALRNE